MMKSNERLNKKTQGAKKARPIRSSSYLTIATQLHIHANKSFDISSKAKNQLTIDNSKKVEFSLSLDHVFVVSHISVKRWPSDKVKENCETNLKVHCVMRLSFKIQSIQMASPKYHAVSQYSKLRSQLLLYSIYSQLILGLS